MKTIASLLAAAALLAVSAFAQIANPYTTGSLSNTATVAFSTGVTLAGATFGNSNASIVYVQVFDAATAGAVTVGTTTPKLIIPVQASSCQTVPLIPGVVFKNGIVIACTTTATGSTAPGSAITATLVFH